MSTHYKYRAYAEGGEIREKTITAESDSQVLEHLAQRRLVPITVERVRRRPPFSLWGFFSRSEYENLILFTRSLSTLHRSGIPLLRALATIKVGRPGGRFNYALSQMRLSLQSGQPLSAAMSEFNDLFPRVYTASVAAGEESGRLDEILEELGRMLEEEYSLVRQIRAGVRYPVMVLSALAAAFVVMIAYVVPKFVSFYGAFDAELPIFTRGLIATSEFFTSYWIFILAALIVAGLVAGQLARVEWARYWIDRRLLQAPVIGDLIVKGNVARFGMLLRILLHSGLPVIRSLEILNDSASNSAFAEQIRRMRELFKEGRDQELQGGSVAVFPEMALSMIAIGLESGSLERTLAEMGTHYASEVRYRSRHLTAILEPLLTLVLGGFVLLLALSIFLPMWNLINVFKGP